MLNVPANTNTPNSKRKLSVRSLPPVIATPRKNAFPYCGGKLLNSVGKETNFKTLAVILFSNSCTRCRVVAEEYIAETPSYETIFNNN